MSDNNKAPGPGLVLPLNLPPWLSPKTEGNTAKKEKDEDKYCEFPFINEFTIFVNSQTLQKKHCEFINLHFQKIVTSLQTTKVMNQYLFPAQKVVNSQFLQL